jgi:hypothetical protein
MRLRIIVVIIALFSLIGASFVQAQDDGTGCYPRARESLKRTVFMEDALGDAEEESLPTLPLLPVFPPQPEPGSPAADPEAWGAAFYRFPIIPAEPGPERDALIAEFGTGTVVDRTIDSEESSAEVDRSIPITLRPGTVVRSRPGSFGEIENIFNGNTNAEALVRDPTGYYLGIRAADGTQGWVFINDLNQPIERMSELQVADPWGVHYSILPPISCNLPNGMVLQSLDDTLLSLAVNNMLIQLEGTAIITTQDTNGDDAADTMFVTVAEGQITTLLPDNPFTMTGIGETVGLELNEQGDIMGYTGVVPEEAQQRDILINAAFTCELFNGLPYVRSANCNIGVGLPLNLTEFINSITETVVVEETEAAPDVPGLDETEVAALPEATALPEGVLLAFNDAPADVFNCQLGSPIAATASSLRADLGYFDVIPETIVTLPYRRTVRMWLHPNLLQDIDEMRENFAIYVYARSLDGTEIILATERHSGQTAYRGRMVGPRQVAQGTQNLVALDADEGWVEFNIPDDVVEIRFESYVEEVPNTAANLCDRYPEQGYHSLGVAEVL